MAKKIIISILILLILGSLGVIGYIVVSQNPNFSLNLARFWPFGSASNTQAPKVPANFFPEATSTTRITPNATTSNITNSPSPDNSNLVNNNPSLAGTSAVGLALISSNKTEKVLFIDRASGNLYKITDQNNLTRLTNETIDNIGEVYWGGDKTGERVILRQTKDGQITNLSGLIKSATGTSTDLDKLNTQILSPNISAIAISPDRTKFFTLEKSDDGIIGYLNDWANSKNKKKAWAFAFDDWQVSWPKANLISLQTKASANDLGYLYFLNLDTGSFTRILSGVAGLTAKVAPDGQKVIFSRSGLGKFGFYVYEMATQKTSSMGVNTLPEKCLWADNTTLYCAVPRSISTNSYPDGWYQGKVTFTDDIWKIDLTKKTTELLFPLKGNDDLVNLVLAPSRGWLYAINKSDNSIQSFPLPLP